ncbi:MAG: hypothetical protein RIF32_14195 [Leptospirales bacterium]|jgi:hypothetical protein
MKNLIQKRNSARGRKAPRESRGLSRLPAVTLLILVAGGFTAGRAQSGPDKKYLPQGVLDYGEVESREAVADFGGLHPLLRRFSPPQSEFELDAAAGAVVTGTRGTRLSIPPAAFVTKDGVEVKGRVKIILREVIDAFDFLIAPVGLEYTENGRREWFQSGGMFHVSATRGGEELILAPNQTIIVHFPNVQPGDFKIYRTNADGDWVRRGDIPKTTDPNGAGDVVPARAAGDSETGDGFENEMKPEGMSTVGAHILAIDSMTWWNFDSPYPHVACVKGKLVDPDGVFAGDYQVFSIGVDYRGSFSRWSSGTEFRVNAHKDRQTKILVIDRKGNVGISSIIKTSKRSGFDQEPEGPENFCQALGEAIPIREVPENLLKDRREFMNYLELPADRFGVNYGEAGG